MPKIALTPTEEQIASIDPASGPWSGIEILHRQFHYTPLADDEGNPSGFAYARNGDVITLLHHEDLVRGLKIGAFVDPTSSHDEGFGEGPGDYTARPDLVEYVKDHKTDDVLAYVGSDPDLAQLMMEAELQAKPNGGEPRKGVLAGLQAVIDAYLDPSTPADAPLTLGDHASAVASGSEPESGTITEPAVENEDGDDGDDSSEEE